MCLGSFVAGSTPLGELLLLLSGLPLVIPDALAHCLSRCLAVCIIAFCLSQCLSRCLIVVSLSVSFSLAVSLLSQCCAGGGVVGFPVAVLVLGFDSPQGRDFAVLIQAVGMNSAAFLILYTKPHMVKPSLPGMR